MANHHWTVLLYFSGDTPTLAASIKADVEEALRARPQNISVAIQADLPAPDGARRYVYRPGETPSVEELGQIDSGSPATFREFLLWGLNQAPADRYGLIVGGTGMFDPNSVVGHPDHNWTDVFAICDDAAARNAMDIADFRGVLEAVLDEACLDRL